MKKSKWLDRLRTRSTKKTRPTQPSGSAELLRVLRDQLKSGPVVEQLNRLRQMQVWLILIACSLALMWASYNFGDRFGLLMGFFLALALNILVIFYVDWRLEEQFPGPDLEGNDPYGVVSITRDLSRQLKQPMPRLRQVSSATPFLFSAGLVVRQLRVFISTAALEKLSPEELRALIAQQLMRYHTNQTRLATAAAALADIFLIAAGTLDTALGLRFILPLLKKSPPPRHRPGPFTWLILPPVILFLRLVIHHKSICAIDHLTHEKFQCGEALARALIKLDSYAKTLPPNVNYAEASLFVVDPLASLNISPWTAVQPPIRERIALLAGRYPL